MRYIFINGRAIRDGRLAVGLRSFELADALGCSRPYISKLEKGNEKVSYEFATKLAKAFKYLGISMGTSPYGLYFVAKDIKESAPPKVSNVGGDGE